MVKSNINKEFYSAYEEMMNNKEISFFLIEDSESKNNTKKKENIAYQYSFRNFKEA